MDKQKPTLAVYGIQDHGESDTPLTVHDHGLALFAEGRLVKLLQLERRSRRKRDNSLHKQIYDILKDEGLIAVDYDLIFVDNVVGRAFISQQGNMRFEAPLSDGLKNTMEKGVCHWVNQSRDGYVLNHELAHIFSCLPFYGEFRENSLLVHFDGGASQCNFSAWHWHKGAPTLIEHHWDLKYLSSFFNANALNFSILGAKRWDQNSVPGKLMGFAALGQYRQSLESWLKDNNYFSDVWKSRKEFFEKAKQYFGFKHNRLVLEEPFIQDVVATFQGIFVRDLLLKLRELQARVGAEYLYYTGGSALNIVANSKILAEEIFKDVFIPPCAEDSGLALGAGAYMEFLKHGEVRPCSPYLNNWGISDYTVEYDASDIQAVAASIMAGQVIGICNGFGEVGPRALGNRSLVALANNEALAQKVSQVHKRREWYRPTAPVMLESDLSYFTGKSGHFSLSKYMLMDFDILPDKRSEIEGVVHANGSARIQTIGAREDNPYLYDLLCHLKSHYGIRALINTSFNTQGEPIVHTCDDAIRSARDMGIDAVVLNGRLKPIKTATAW